MASLNMAARVYFFIDCYYIWTITLRPDDNKLSALIIGTSNKLINTKTTNSKTKCKRCPQVQVNPVKFQPRMQHSPSGWQRYKSLEEELGWPRLPSCHGNSLTELFEKISCTVVGSKAEPQEKIWPTFNFRRNGWRDTPTSGAMVAGIGGRTYLRHWDDWQVGVACTRSANVLFFTTFTL